MTKESMGRPLRLLLAGFIAAIGIRPVGAAVVINEIMYHPAFDIETQEYVELYNSGPGAAILTGWRLAGAIGYSFPTSKTIASGGYLVIAKSVAAFHTRYPASTADVIGDYTGQLDNAGEEILLYDAAMNLVDRVAYDDEGHWPRAADGNGSSLELVNPHLDNSIAQSWAASSAGGTPGLRNSQYVANPRPFLVQPRHAPAVPRSTDPIAITARAYDDSAITSVTLFYRGDGAAGSFAQTRMWDDGAHGDGAAADGVYGALLSPQPQGTILEFWMRAADNTMQTTDIPSTAPLLNFLLQVDNQDFSATSPTYRLVMKAADHYTLHSRDRWSDVLLNATFISGEEIYYNIGVRFRGKGARGLPRKSYRVQFTEQEPFHGIENMNLNANQIRGQYLDMDLFQRAGLPASSVQFAYLVFKYNDKNTYYVYDGNPGGEPDLVTMGWRVQVQDVDKHFVRQRFAGHSTGDLYRGTYPRTGSGGRSADLTYWGTDKELYRQYYEKHTNEEADNFSDVIQLCNIFTNAPDAQFTTTVAQHIVPDEWMRFWAAHAVVNTDEINITTTRGDEYFIYFDPATSPPISKAILIPWDFEKFLSPTDTIWKCTLPYVKRFCENPDYTPRYFYHIQDMLDRHFTLDIMLPKIQALAPYYGWETSPASGVSADTMSLAEMSDYVQKRIAFLESLISRELTVNVIGAAKVGSEYIAFQPTVTLNGRGLTAWTRWVRVNGHDAGYQFKTGNWGDYVVNLNPGPNTVVVECLTTASARAASKTLNIRYATSFTPVCGMLSGDTVWTKAGSPYRVTCNVVVPGGRTLRIEPGTIAMLNPGCSIFVLGTLLAEGTEAEPIFFASSAQGSSSAVLIAAGARWRYNDKGIDLGTAWRANAYNESAWSSGPAQLGYGETSQATLLSYGSDSNNKHPCYYFRHSFQLSDPTAVTALTFHVARDDGCVIYLNNNEAMRDNMPPPPAVISYGTWASANLNDPDENAWNAFPASPSQLIAGTNVVAVEVHQQNAQSTDLIFDLELTASQTARWGVIGFNGAAGLSRLAHCDFDGGSVATYAGQSFGGEVSVINSSVEIEDSRFHNYSANAVNATTGTGIIAIRRSFFDVGGLECISSNLHALTVEDSTFTYRTQTPANAITLRGQTTPPPIVRRSHFLGSVDDVLVLGNSNAAIESNAIHDGKDVGIQLGSGSHSNVHHNVIYDCGRGILVRNGSIATLDHNTLYGITTGTQCRHEAGVPGTGGGTATITNTIIWACPTPVSVDSLSSTTVRYSDIAGGRAGTGNFNLDPQFVDVGTKDFHIRPTSPCANRGQGGTYVGAFPAAAAPSTAARNWHLY